jgi:hypothetical protein
MDFTQRDDQFARIVPGLVRLFPADIVTTVVPGRSARLSETWTARWPPRAGRQRRRDRYGQAWRTVGQPPQRERQIA